MKVSPFIEETDLYVQQIKQGLNSILVTVRVRPLNSKQKLVSTVETVKVLDEKLLVLMEPENNSITDVLRKNRNKENKFAFDFVFDHNIQTPYIYENCISMLLDGLFQGYNATVLSYGSTSCGKTYTMVGEGEQPGIMALSVLDILNTANQLKKTKNIQFKASYIEIYNENIKDLLISEDKNFDLREDPKEGVSIAGITEVSVSTLSQIKMLLKVGAKNRTKESTGSNENSSRSHAILQIQIQTKDKAQSTVQEINISKLSLVDLAGSQRASKTTNRGQRMVQGAKINQSLLTLGNCIQTLSEANQKGIKNVFVPYRGSKLTRLLKDSLGGNCRTVMIAHVSPAVSAYQQTYNTLIYANRAKNIKNNASRNILNADTHITNYVNVINSLKKENQQLKSQLKNKKYSQPSMPLLQNSGYQEQIQKYEKSISSVMDKKNELIVKLAEIANNIEIQAFQIFANQLRREGEAVNRKKSGLISELAKNKIEIEKKVEELDQEVDKIQKQVRKNDILGKMGQPYVLNHIKETKIKVEEKALKLKAQAMDHQKQLITNLLKKIKKDLNVRDRIIESQKILIKKNNIISRITYSQLNYSLDESKQKQKQNQVTSPKLIARNLSKDYKYTKREDIKKESNDKSKRQGNFDSLEKPMMKKNQTIDMIQKIQKASPKNRKIKMRFKISEDGTSQEDSDTLRAQPNKLHFHNKIKSSNKNSIPEQKLKRVAFSQNKITDQRNKKKPKDQKFQFVYLPH